MKRLNRKGFTLVELLAVIVILAIVVGIALTTVLPTLKKSRQNAFDLTANTAADYLEKQYQLSMIGEVDPSTIPTQDSTDQAKKMEDTDFAKAGLKAGNYDNGTWYIDTTKNRACVTLTKSDDGQYYDANDNEGVATSDGCH